MGMQSLSFYVVMSWLPAIMRGQGYAPATAGLMLSVMMLLGIPTGLVAPMLAARLRDQRPLVAVVMALMAAGRRRSAGRPAGWLDLGDRAGPRHRQRVPARLHAPHAGARAARRARPGCRAWPRPPAICWPGLGPFAFGVLHDVTGGWQVPLTMLLVWLIPETLIAWRAARPGQISTALPVLVHTDSPTPAHPVPVGRQALRAGSQKAVAADVPGAVRAGTTGPHPVHVEPKPFIRPVHVRR